MILLFQIHVDRKSTNSIKWNPELVSKWCNMEGDDLLSYWVADMDYRCPEPIIESIQAVAATGIFGYSDMTCSYYQSVIDWYRRRMKCNISRDWICYSNGIVPTLNYILQEFCERDDMLIIQPPVYYPFVQAANNNGVGLLSNKLLYEDGRYSIDFDDLERKASNPHARVMFLCSPHNPVGRVWDRLELERVASICKENGVLLVSDEIHGDIVFSPSTFHSMLSFEKYLDNLIVCSSPSKSFNIAGLQMSNIIIPNSKLREQFMHALIRNSILLPNTFGPAAVQAAYNHCEGWLDEMLIALQYNIATLQQNIQQNLPLAQLVIPQGTYLAWIDMGSYPYGYMERAELIKTKAHVVLDHGYIFGDCGTQFERINFACPTALLTEGISRIATAM